MEETSRQRAYFATGSRLLTCAVNEGLVKTLYYCPEKFVLNGFFEQSTKTTESLSSKECNFGIIFILPDNQKIQQIKEIFSVRVNHKPLLYKNNEKKFISEVENIDPCDMLPPIKKLSLDTEFRSMDEEKEDEENKFELFCKKCANLFEIGGIKISPVDIMRVFGDWLNLNNELIDLTCSELKSSCEYQEFIYRHPKPMPTLNSTSIEWEQSLIESHPTHPLHKSRKTVPPISEIVPGSYDFEKPLIRFALVPHDKVCIRGSFEEGIRQLVDTMKFPKPNIPSDKVLVPFHELQLPIIKSKFPHVEILPIEYSIRANSQTNIRTVVFPNLPGLAFKLPLGMIVTSAMRTISPWAAHLGVGLTPVLKKLNINWNILKIAYELASVISTDSGPDVANHLGCIIRQDVNDLDDSEKVIICGALTEKDENGKSVVEKVWNLDTEQKRIDFLDRYLRILFEAFLPPALDNGFTFEPHQQNTRARFSSKTGELIGFIIRDFGGIRFHQDTLVKTLGIRVDALKGSSTESKDLVDVYNKLYHSLITVHVHRLIRALNLHYNGIGWQITRENLIKIIPKDHLLWWDEWVPEERLLKLNEESLQKQKQLKELHSTKNKKRQPKIPKVDGKPSPKVNEVLVQSADSNSKNQEKVDDGVDGVDGVAVVGGEIKSLKIILNKQDQNQTKKRGADAMDLDLDDSTQEGATKVLGKQKADQAEENIERVEVKRIRIKLGGSNNNKVDVKGKQVEKIHDKVEENQEVDVNNTQEKNESVNVEFKIPQFLLDKLVEDWEFITKYKRNLLLYKEENIQNSEIHKTHPNKEWTDLYGAEHLLRLFVKFPELLSQAQMNQKEKENFETNIIDFLNFLETNESKYFEKLSGQNSKSIAAKKQKTNIKRTRTTKVHDNPYGFVCSNCKTTNTPNWRAGETPDKKLCNACGLYFSKYRKHRPESLWNIKK
nr:12310_t:CDS:10 [Entrophospora candida]